MTIHLEAPLRPLAGCLCSEEDLFLFVTCISMFESEIPEIMMTQFQVVQMALLVWRRYECSVIILKDMRKHLVVSVSSNTFIYPHLHSISLELI